MSIANSETNLDRRKGAKGREFKKVRHPRIDALLDDLDVILDPVAGDDIVLLVGPTGVGKTTLLKYLHEHSASDSELTQKGNPGYIPAVCIEAPASGEKEFSWAGFYKAILRALQDPFPERRNFPAVDKETNKVIRRAINGQSNLSDLREAVERALDARRTEKILVDEGVHFVRYSRPVDLAGHVDTLKSLTNTCGVRFLLAGSYDLYRVATLSDQLARRCGILHFSRYVSENKADVMAFSKVVNTFCREYPDHVLPDLRQHTAVLLENVLGCVGTLSKVIKRAARYSEKQGRWDLSCLQRALLTTAQHGTILEEIIEGERKIAEGTTPWLGM